MPELPEVETIVRDLEPELLGRAIVEVRLLAERSLSGTSPAVFASALLGRSVQAVRRRAKFILIGLDGADWLSLHLGMTGSLVVSPTLLDGPHLRCALRLDDGRWLLFRDMRRFGRLRLLSEADFATLGQRLGPEPLEPGFGPEDLRRRLGSRRLPIKTALLNQALLAGLGNIYADEALFRARIHPLRAAGSLSPEESARLHTAIMAVLQEAIGERGTSFSDYRDAFGEKGQHEQSLQVYRRTGLPCGRCQHTISRIVVGGRSTHYCPSCQPESLAEVGSGQTADH